MTVARTTLADLETSRMGLGCMGMTFAYAGAEHDRSLRTLDRALEVGVTMLDSADIYGPRSNEELLAEWLPGRRDRVELVTKFGGYSLEERGRAPDGRPDYAQRACDASLARLGVDVIDLYYLHRVDPQVPIEETVGAMGELVEQGKVRHIGLSEAGPETIRRAHATHPITAVQSEWSLWTRDVEPAVVPTLRELGIGLVAYSPLGRGMLTGAITSPDDLAEDDWRRDNPRFQGEAFAANLELVEAVQGLAADKGCTPAQLALAWVLQQGDDVVPIPGTTRPERVEENVAALEVELTPADLADLERIAPPGVAQGLRYPEASMATIET